jgi:hypothetical protein
MCHEFTHLNYAKETLFWEIGGPLMRSVGATLVTISFAAIVGVIILPKEGIAYIDPGTTGVLSQVLYVLFYGALGVFFYFLRSIKQHLTNSKEFLKRFLGRSK